jgi:glutaredoxin-like YruB-family protein
MSDVTIYTTPTCQYCKKTKTFFNENDIEYKEHDVAEDRDRAKEMIEKSGQRGVPVVVIEDDGEEEVVVGFNEDRLSELLGIEA